MTNTLLVDQEAGYRRFLANLTLTAIVAAVYFGAAKFGLALAFAHASASPVWPPTGIALAAALCLGYRVWAGVWVGAFLANVTTAGSIATSMGIATGNVLEALAGAYLINRYARGRRAFDRPQDVFKFVVLAAIASTAISATLGVTSLALGGFAEWADYASIWLTWWLGDAVGALVVTPLLILWSVKSRLRWNGWRAAEAAVLLLMLVLVGLLAFGALLPLESGHYPLVFICIPFLIWAAVRFSPREAATAGVVLSVIAIWGTLNGFGQFVREAPNESLLLLQTFMGIVAMVALVLAAAVSEQKRIEVALQESNQALERSNADLQRFAYVASHDLQTPLRSISGFVQLLHSEYAGRLDEQADDWIRRTIQSTELLQRSIRDLLEYSRVDSEARPFEPVPFRGVFDRAILLLDASIRDSRAQVTCDELPTLMGDPSQLVQVMQNLVGNALTYRGDAPPRVHVRAERSGREWVFSVRDNGIGIAPQHRERIFEIFQRLHNQQEYPGTGIGLAVCRRVVQRHGGRIWVESAPDRGSIFHFTIPEGTVSDL